MTDRWRMMIYIYMLVVCVSMHAGFTVKDTGCCGRGGPYKGLVPCVPNSTFCANRFDYVFWDPYHPTEKTNVILAGRFFGDGYSYPVNLKQLLSS